MVSKAECSKAGKELSTLKSNGTKTREVRMSAAGKKLAQCRWGAKPKKKPKKKPATKKPKAAPKAAVRKSRRLAGQAPVRQPEPAKTPRA